jgi:hypothetical protein
LATVEEQIRERALDRQDMEVLRPSSYEGVKSYDGIDHCAERVLDDIERKMDFLQKEERPVDRISIVGSAPLHWKSHEFFR